MAKNINPIAIANDLRDTYLRYLETSFHFKDSEIQKQYRELLRDRAQPPLVRRPILEISPGYQVGSSLSDLINKDVLSEGLASIPSDAYPLDRALYKHQVEAIEKAVKKNRNLIIATGTGSGKTEAFLFPIINHLLTEAENDTLKNVGIRALLLYPMNALANDQIARLRGLLSNHPQITFGRYTGETKPNYEEALDAYRMFNDGSDPLPNEMICRDQMRERAPHILFTNYAMLEYLLIRPVDSTLFRGAAWKYIVLDEVHTYTGALGIEIAMLLRRLKERVVKSEKGRIQCIGTSATLGGGKKDFRKIAEFASTLFNESFEESDIIGAKHLDLPAHPKPWGTGTKEFYTELNHHITESTDFLIEDLVEVINKHMPTESLVAQNIIPQNGDNKSKCQELIYLILQGDAKVQKLRNLLQKKRTLELEEIEDIDPNEVIEIVSLGYFARLPGNPIPLIPARYHIMTRAVSSVFAWFDHNNSLKLVSKPHHFFKVDAKNSYSVFEVASCNRCGEVFLVGIEESKGVRKYLRQPPGVGDDPIGDTKWYTLKKEASESTFDEDDVVDNEEIIGQYLSGAIEPKTLCRICGRIDDTSTFALETCGDHDPEPVLLNHIINKPRKFIPKRCPSCGNCYGTVTSRMLTGKEVPVAVLSTILYQNIPPSDKKSEKSLPGGGRKLMMFSDSRQDAAFFAPFMDNTYNKFKQRRYLVQALKGLIEPLDFEEWAYKARKAAERAGEWEEFVSPFKRKKEALSWVAREWIATDRRLSLEGAGIAYFYVPRPDSFTGIQHLSIEPWNLNVEEQWTLIQVLLDSVRYLVSIRKARILFTNK